MKACELIEQLEELDPNLNICFFNKEEGVITPIRDARTIMYLDNGKECFIGALEGKCGS